MPAPDAIASKAVRVLDLVALWYARGFIILLLAKEYFYPYIVISIGHGAFHLSGVGVIYLLAGLSTIFLRFNLAKLFLALWPVSFIGIIIYFTTLQGLGNEPFLIATILSWFIASFAIMSYVGFRALWRYGGDSNGNQSSTVSTSPKKRSTQTTKGDNSSHSSAIPLIPSNLAIP